MLMLNDNFNEFYFYTFYTSSLTWECAVVNRTYVHSNIVNRGTSLPPIVNAESERKQQSRKPTTIKSANSLNVYCFKAVVGLRVSSFHHKLYKIP